MKQKDIALIVVIIVVSAVFSYFISKAIFVKPSTRQQLVEVVRPITTDFPQPDSRFFNTSAYDPTAPINVTQNTNANPFSQATNQ